MTHVLHVIGRLADAIEAELLAATVANGEVFEEAPDVVTAEHWSAAGCILVESDTVDELLRRHFDRHRRPGVVLIGHNPDDAAIWSRAVALGAEVVAVLPDQSDLVADAIKTAVRPERTGWRQVHFDHVRHLPNGDHLVVWYRGPTTGPTRDWCWTAWTTCVTDGVRHNVKAATGTASTIDAAKAAAEAAIEANATIEANAAATRQVAR